MPKRPALKTPRGQKKAAPPQDEALLEALAQRFSDRERSVILSGALQELDPAGRARLYARLSSSAAAALSALLEAAPSPAKVAPSGVSEARLEQDWQETLKAWQAIIRQSNQSQSRYLQNEISYTTQDLDTEGIAADLEGVAA